MPQHYIDAILKYLADRSYRPVKPRQFARQLGIDDNEYGAFREAVKQLRDEGRVVLGANNALTLPEISSQITGFYRPNPRGFGFVIPETPNAHGDLFIPEGSAGTAMAGDLVVARVFHQGKKAGKAMYAGEIIQIVRRGRNRFVGTMARADDGTWFVLPDGAAMTQPIVVRDVSTASPKAGTKVVVEITEYPKPGRLPIGVIVERLGEAGELDVETRAVIRAHGLSDEWPAAALTDARDAIAAFDRSTGVSPVPSRAAKETSAVRTDRHGQDARATGREDLTAMTVVTIDPPDARDYDDAISIQPGPDGSVVLGVHIADVSHFVREGSALDREARQRGNSTYFPRRVVPMLPEILSNGVCSLQAGQRRFCKSVFIRYDDEGNVLGTRFADSVIRSAGRLTYIEAQGIIDRGAGISRDAGILPALITPAPSANVDGKSTHNAGETPASRETPRSGGFAPGVAELVLAMNVLAKTIEARRRRAGMLHLDLPEVELVFDEQDHVVDATPRDDSYTHTVIEMFMVEANEAVATLLDRLGRPCVRRIHPQPDDAGAKQLRTFVHACGHKLPGNLSRRDMQELLRAVRGKPESYAVNLALLKTFEQAVYSPMTVGHFALASEHYCHFTSPIRRYADLTVHRLLGEHIRGTLESRPGEDRSELVHLGENLTATERRSKAAEDELREVLILEFLATKIGEDFDGVVTGVTSFGLFVQSMRFLIEGLVRLEDLGDDWWEVDPKTGTVVGERTRRKIRLGDMMRVRIASVDIAKRQLNLSPTRERKSGRVTKKVKKPNKNKKTFTSRKKRRGR
ncbi:MAG: RNB domain-containing ribonuclease [Phycisphaerae bacterium]|nr:RNB domain-containing ribonuclease [Phycisphaerae bacterium]